MIEINCEDNIIERNNLKNSERTIIGEDSKNDKKDVVIIDFTLILLLCLSVACFSLISWKVLIKTSRQK